METEPKLKHTKKLKKEKMENFYATYFQFVSAKINFLKYSYLNMPKQKLLFQYFFLDFKNNSLFRECFKVLYYK